MADEDEHNDEVSKQNLKIREFELARRLKLEQSFGRNQLSPEENDGNSTANDVENHLGVDDRKRWSNRMSLGAFSRKRYSAMVDTKSIKLALGKKTQTFDVARDVPLWFEKICELEGVTDAETLIVQNEVMQNETHMMKMWSKEAFRLIQIKSDESELRDFSELEELRSRNEELEKDTVISWLGVEALASVVNPEERKALMNRNKGSRIKGEKDLIHSLEAKRKEIAFSYFRRSKMRQVELDSTFSEGSNMLSRFGELMESACNNMIQNNKSKLLEELHKHGIEVGRMRSTDATSKLHRKILLNSLDKSSGIALVHNDLTMVRLPSLGSNWAYAHASDGPWRVRRFDKELLKGVTRAALEQINLEHATSADALRNLAKVLDAINTSGDSKLHEQVIETPHRAKELLQGRLEQFGLGFQVEGQTSLTRIRNEIDLKRAIKQSIEKVNDRLEFHGRFYFETHFHQVDGSELPFDTEDESQVRKEFESKETLIADVMLKSTEQNQNKTQGNEETSDLKSSNLDDDFDGDDGESGDEDTLLQHPSLNRVPEIDAEDPTEVILYGVLNDYEEPDEGMWMIGVSFDTLKCCGFPGNDPFSFGIRSDGTVWHNGVPRRFCGNLVDEVVIGFLLDLNVGSITLFAGGACVGVAFGVDASAYPPAEQKIQGELIRTKHLIPGFALKARRSVAAADVMNEGFDERELDADENEIEDDDGILAGISSLQNHSELQSPISPLRESRTKTSFDIPSPPLSEQNTFRSNLSLEVPQDIQVPALSVNFGGYSFSRLPPQSMSCDSYLSFATEAQKSEDRKRFAEAFKNQVQKIVTSQMEEQDDDFDFADISEDGVLQEGLIGSQGVVLEYRNRIAFFNEMQYPKPQSWSNFPPQSHQIGYSASTLQRAVRRFLGKKWRQREMLTQTLAITLLQRKIRKTLPRWRKKKINAALMVQRVWRGRRVRKQIAFAMQFAKRPDILAGAATKIQSQFRRVIAEEKVRQVAEAAELEIQNIVDSAERIQRNWRKHKDTAKRRELAIATRSVALLQKLWRGRLARLELMEEIGPEAQQRLNEIGSNIVLTNGRIRAAKEIQRLWRGKADRDYAGMKKIAYHSSAVVVQRAWFSYRVKNQVDELCDTGPAYAVKKFLRVIGAIMF